MVSLWWKHFKNIKDNNISLKRNLCWTDIRLCWDISDLQIVQFKPVISRQIAVCLGINELSWWWKQLASLKRPSVSVRLRDSTSHGTHRRENLKSHRFIYIYIVIRFRIIFSVIRFSALKTVNSEADLNWMFINFCDFVVVMEIADAELSVSSPYVRRTVSWSWLMQSHLC